MYYLHITYEQDKTPYPILEEEMKKPVRVVAIVMFLLMVVAALAACSTPAAPVAEQAEAPAAAPAEVAKEYYMGKLPITLSHAVHGNDAKWAEQYAREKYGAKYEVIDPAGDLQKQIKGVEDFIAKGVDGIILHPVQESGVNEVIVEARQAGVYVITYFMKATEVEVPFVRVDETGVARQMGADMAKQWKELYPDKPIKVGFIDFLSVNYGIDNRSGPFMEGVMSVDPTVTGLVNNIKNSNGDVVSGATFWLAAEGDLTKSQAIGQDVLQKYPEVNLIYGTNTPNALGALSAYEAAGRGKAVDGVPLTEIFAGTDGDAPELIKLADPTSSLKYTLGMQPQTFAYAQVDLMMDVMMGKVAPDEPYEVISEDVYFNFYKNTVKEMQDWFNTQYYGNIDIAAELAKK
jgi:ABC-type sugar transport system substrate-binding protein